MYWFGKDQDKAKYGSETYLVYQVGKDQDKATACSEVYQAGKDQETKLQPVEKGTGLGRTKARP